MREYRSIQTNISLIGLHIKSNLGKEIESLCTTSTTSYTYNLKVVSIHSNITKSQIN
jgi:hypothetical protein